MLCVVLCCVVLCCVECPLVCHAQEARQPFEGEPRAQWTIQGALKKRGLLPKDGDDGGYSEVTVAVPVTDKETDFDTDKDKSNNF